jgi:lysophospholipase L1-like esterase
MSSDPPNLPPRRRTVGWLAVLLVNFLLLALIEGASWFILDRAFPGAIRNSRKVDPVEQPFDVLAGWTMASNTVICDRGSRIETGPDGFPVVPDPLPDPEFTLVVTGGSTMFGIGVTNNADTVPSQIQTVLRRDHGLAVNVINLSVRGYVGFQEMVTLERFLTTRRAEAVVSLSGYNDATAFLTPNAGPGGLLRKSADAVTLARQAESGEVRMLNLLPWLARHTYTACLAAHLMARTPPPPVPVPPAALSEGSAEISRAIRTHAASYAMMDGACRTRGLLFKMYLQPTANTKQTLSENERQVLEKKNLNRRPGEVEIHRNQQALYYASFRSLEKTFPFADLSGSMGDSRETCYTDRCHYTRHGGELLARAVAADLAPLLTTRRSSHSTASP